MSLPQTTHTPQPPGVSRTASAPPRPAQARRTAPGARPPARAQDLFDSCVTLGYHCEPTHQVRRLTGTDRAHFFDWLDLDHEAVVQTLESDFRQVLAPGLTEPFEGGGCALDRGSDIRFFHDFRPAAPGRPLTRSDIDRQFPRVRAKFTFLAERWREMEASGRRVLYVHLDAFDELVARDLHRLRAVLAGRHPAHRFALLWLRRSRPDAPGRLPPGTDWATVPHVPGRWQGDDRAWDAVFASLDPERLWPRDPAGSAPSPTAVPR